MAIGTNSNTRLELLDWFKGCAIMAVVLDHLKAVPGLYVVWSVNLFVLVTAFVYSQPGYVFSAKKWALKIFQLIYLTAFALLFVGAVQALFHINRVQSVLAVFLNPYSFWVHNDYLGDIWYISLHLQLLTFFYFYLKRSAALNPLLMAVAAAAVNFLSIVLTHVVLQRFHTILGSSWLVFLAAGFYGMRPFLNWIRDFPHSRWLGLAAGLGLMLAMYGCYPLFPWLFTNGNRAFFMSLPFYVALILFLTETFYLLKLIKLGRALESGIFLLGRYSLAIYLTHQPFKVLWRLVLASDLLAGLLCVLSGLVFGMLSDRIFLKMKLLLSREMNRKGLRLGGKIAHGNNH